MGYKKTVLSEQDRTVLKEFLACPVPKKFFALDGRGNTQYDFNYGYQEVYDYSDALLRGEEVDLDRNFLGMRAVSVNSEFCKVLEVVGRRDADLEIFCEKLSDAIGVILRMAR